MRLSTSLIFNSGSQAIGRQQSELFRTQQQLASGRRMLEPADDPVAASEALRTDQALNVTGQYGSNLARAKDALALTESVVGQVNGLLQDVRVLALNGNTTLTDSDRASIAGELEGRLQQLIGLANTGDGNGGYLFSGFQQTTQPFTATGNGAMFSGDQGQRLLQVSAGRQIAVSENGNSLFERIKAGNGTFVVKPAVANTGTGFIQTTSVVSPGQLTGHNYRIDFAVTAGNPPVTTYNVVDTTTSTTLSTGNAYTAGAAITFDGMQFTVSGEPANGDQLTVAPSTNQSMFTTIADLIQVLRATTSGPASRAKLSNGINEGLRNIDQALNNVLSVRAGLGARMNEVDALSADNQDQSLQFQQNLSRLQDLDYNKAISDLSRQQVALQAAQQSFARISQLSLFNLL